MADPAGSPTQDEDTLPAKGETVPRRPWRAYFEAEPRLPQSLVSGVLQPAARRGRVPRPGHARRAHPVQARRRRGLRHRGPLPAPRRAVLGAPGVLHQEHHHLLVSRLHLRRARRQAGRHHHRPRKPADRPGSDQGLSGRGAQEPGLRLHRRRDAARRSRSTCSRASSTTISRSIRTASTRSSRATGGSPPRTASTPRTSTSTATRALVNAARAAAAAGELLPDREGMVVDQEARRRAWSRARDAGPRSGRPRSKA